MVRRRVRSVPLPVVVIATITLGFLVIPFVGLLSRAAWATMWQDLTSPVALSALRLSLECSLAATALSVIFGVPLAWVLARATIPGRSVVRAFVLLPMVLPPVVGGVALLFAFGRTNGLIGPWLFHTFGLQLTFTPAGVVMAETFVAMPFLVITVEGGFRSLDTRYEEAAETLGAGRVVTFLRVTLPLLKPSLFAGAALAWARALGEFGATITFAGNIQGKTETTPLAVYLLLESDPNAAIALSLVLLLVSLIILITLRDRWFGLRR